MVRLEVSNQWDPAFAARSPMFSSLDAFYTWYQQFENHWPTLADYQCLLDAQPSVVMSSNRQPLQIVPQAGKPSRFEQHYAPRIYMSGEIQTRTENWHDFFQLLTWMMFPRTKALINETHIPLAQRRIEAGTELGRRTPLENMLSLFDEGGAVVVSSDRSLLQMICDFQWKPLFWQQRQTLHQRLRCVVFGHAMYEKGLEPYLGMTANSILLHCDASFFQLSNSKQLAWIDEKLVQTLADRNQLSTPRDLAPFPILGMPGWDRDNRNEHYYDNLGYFRPGRRRVKS